MVKKYNDYIDDMCILFPELSKEDITDIVKYGCKKMFMYITEGHDVAFDYKHPKSSILISSRNDTGMTRVKKIKLKRKEH